MRSLASRALAPALALLVAVGGAVPAAAEDGTPIRSQWYVGSSGLADLRQQGLDGSGITIALIDVAPPADVPELRDAQVSVTDPCTDASSRSDIEHTTAVLSLLASPEYGWAPRASYHVYVRPDTNEPTDAGCAADLSYTVAALINRALDDGADLISIQVVESVSESAGYAVARAELAGVPVIAGVGNDGTQRILTTSRLNYTVGVGASTKKGTRARFSNRGLPLTVSAPGVDLTVRRFGGGGELSRIERTQGTSYATPMVTGALALAMQAWPQATANQLVGSMMVSANRTTSDYDPQLGWGVLDARELVATDPTGYPTESPLSQKNPGDYPSPEQVADYRDGLADPSAINGDDTYVYRGDDELICDNPGVRCELNTSPRFASASPGASPAGSVAPASSTASPAAPATPTAAPAAPDGGGALIGIGIAAAVVAIGVLAAVLLRRRNGARR